MELYNIFGIDLDPVTNVSLRCCSYFVHCDIMPVVGDGLGFNRSTAIKNIASVSMWANSNLDAILEALMNFDGTWLLGDSG